MADFNATVDAARVKYYAIMQAAEAKYLADYGNHALDEAAINAEYATITLAAEHQYQIAVQAAYAAERGELRSN